MVRSSAQLPPGDAHGSAQLELSYLATQLLSVQALWEMSEYVMLAVAWWQ